MKRERTIGKQIWGFLILGILFCAMLPGRTGMAAEETASEQNDNQVYSIDAVLLPSDGATYDIQVTISNQGKDWEGTARVQTEDSYDAMCCVYDTAISLPEGSTKQFAVRIPKESIEYSGGTLNVSLVSESSQVIAQQRFKRFFLMGADALSVGILSDSYSALTYLDLGGESIYYDGVEFPIKLWQLDQDSLTGALDSLIILVIDNYNTGVLSDSAKERIEEWVNRGGLLIVGTGGRAEEVLSGLPDFGVACDGVNEPGTSDYDGEYPAELNQLELAQLKDLTGRYDMQAESLIMVTSWGAGAVEFVPYALTDLGRLLATPAGMSDEGCYVSLLQNINSYTYVNSNSHKYYDNNYILRRIFRTFGNGGNRLNFGLLKWIVVLYVIFVGPVLYLILSFMKKRDWYWIAVPVSTLAGIILIYITGSGFEVVNTRVYSVTVEGLGKDLAEAVTYMHCYDADYEEWELRLAEQYAYVGPVINNYYYDDSEGYYYRVQKEGERLTCGMDPGAGFEDAYFMAGTSRKFGAGSISSVLKPSVKWGITGTVTNETDRDFRYFAVISDNQLYVYENLPAGETRELEKPNYMSGQGTYDNATEAYLQGYMISFYRGKEKKDADIIAALGMGVSVAEAQMIGAGGTTIIGVTENWQAAVDDDCVETSYGCLYSIQ